MGNSTNSEDQDKDFQPFFTIVKDADTSEHHHPSVHYVFADDDPEVITEAACYALFQQNERQVAGWPESNNTLQSQDIKEHLVLIDVEPGNGANLFHILKSHSLSSDWQILNASISSAPTIDSAASERGERLMLKIEGVSARATSNAVPMQKDKGETLQQMVERFEEGLIEVRRMAAIGELK